MTAMTRVSGDAIAIVVIAIVTTIAAATGSAVPSTATRLYGDIIIVA